MSFKVGENSLDLITAYNVIRQNRETKGFQLSMSADEMMEVAKLVKVDSFIVSFEEKTIASAIVYHVTNKNCASDLLG